VCHAAIPKVGLDASTTGVSSKLRCRWAQAGRSWAAGSLAGSWPASEKQSITKAIDCIASSSTSWAIGWRSARIGSGVDAPIGAGRVGSMRSESGGHDVGFG